MNEDEKWECFLCCQEADFEIFPSAYLSNYHPLCSNCANEVLENQDHEQRFRLSYHEDFGNLVMVSNIPIQTGKFTRN